MFKVQSKYHSVDFISNKNITPRFFINQDRLHQTKKSNIWLAVLLLVSFTFENICVQHQQLCLKILFLTVKIQMK